MNPPAASAPAALVVMGVSGCGKSTVGVILSERLSWPFRDGDSFHPPENVEKMRAGIALDDADRWPWLERLAVALHEAAERKGASVGACSALKRAYREYLTEKAGEPILFVYLHGSRELVGERMARRQHEYMPTSLLDSQFATLEEPDPATENVLVVPVTDTVDQITRAVTNSLDHLKTFKRWQ